MGCGFINRSRKHRNQSDVWGDAYLQLCSPEASGEPPLAEAATPRLAEPNPVQGMFGLVPEGMMA